MNKKPKFSICIPNYNYGNYIGETIDSILSQTFQDFEIIIADNCSTDNSIEIIESFNDDRIRLIKNEYNIGFAPNLQKVTQHAKGEYINLLSSDDMMCENSLMTYSNIIETLGDKSEKTIFFSDSFHIDSKGDKIRIIQRGYNSTVKNVHQSQEDYYSLSDKQFTLRPSKQVLYESLKSLRTFGDFATIIYPKNIWEKVGGYNVLRFVGPDALFNYKLLSASNNVCQIHAPLYKYRIHETLNNASQNSNVKQQIDDYLNTLHFDESFLTKLIYLKKN